MFTPPRKYLDLIRHGREATYGDDTGHLSGGSDHYGTAGFEYQNDPGLALRLTQVLVQQGYGDDYVRAQHMKASNVGFLWVRRQADPDAASESLLAQTDRTLKPMLSTKERHARILTLLRTGEVVSQKALVRHVGNARDSYTRRDLRELEEAGVITVEAEQHGKVTWWRVALAATVAVFWELSYQIRKALARRIARLAAKAKGCKRTSVGRQAKPVSPELDLEMDQENQSQPQRVDDATMWAELFDTPMPQPSAWPTGPTLKTDTSPVSTGPIPIGQGVGRSQPTRCG